MDNKKKSGSRKALLLSPAALTLLFGSAFSGNAVAMEPAVDDTIGFQIGEVLAKQQNNNNNNKSTMLAAAKPSSLRQLSANIG